MAVVAAALGWFVAGRALRPLRRITESARRISATNLHERLALEGPDDDLRELADMIDGLFARLDASLHAQRQFVANASHELRTPLARSQTLLEVALRNPDASTGSLRAACERALAAGVEQERLIEALLILARGQRGLARRAPRDLAAVTRDVLAAPRRADRGERPDRSRSRSTPGLLAGDAALARARRGQPGRQRAAAQRAWRHRLGHRGRGRTAVRSSPSRTPGRRSRRTRSSRLLLPFQRGGEAGDAYRARARTGPMTAWGSACRSSRRSPPRTAPTSRSRPASAAAG